MHTKRFNAFWVQFRLGVIPRLPLFSASNISLFLSVGFKKREKLSTNRDPFDLFHIFTLFIYTLNIPHYLYLFFQLLK